MKTRKTDTITSNEDQVRFEIFAGILPLDRAGEELLRLERCQHDAERARHAETHQEVARLRALLANG